MPSVSVIYIPLPSGQSKLRRIRLSCVNNPSGRPKLVSYSSTRGRHSPVTLESRVICLTDFAPRSSVLLPSPRWPRNSAQPLLLLGPNAPPSHLSPLLQENLESYDTPAWSLRLDFHSEEPSPASGGGGWSASVPLRVPFIGAPAVFQGQLGNIQGLASRRV